MYKINLSKYRIPNWELATWEKDTKNSNKYWLVGGAPRAWNLVNNPYEFPVDKETGRVYVVVPNDMVKVDLNIVELTK